MIMKVLVIACILLLAVSGCIAQSAVSAGGHDSDVPALKFSVYAPPQGQSPIRIVQFVYTFDDVKVVLVNDSDKWITGAWFVARLTPPPGCSMGETATIELSGSKSEFHIAPHQKIEILVNSSPFGLANLVKTAQLQEMAGAQVQVGVMNVYFSDGTEWHTEGRLSAKAPIQPFSPSLVADDTGLCSSFAEVAKALPLIRGTQPERASVQSEMTNVHDERLPHLLFQCSLEAGIAHCRAEDRKMSSDH
ncbi:MAG TPA: hypothetical protein VG897_12435 [Terriglobales bacterium]|nr:hypothetical protein [Terriglobales bacterium]